MKMGLFSRKKKTPTVTPTNSFNQPLDQLVDGELPFGWYAHFRHIVKPKDDQMVAFALKTKTPDEGKRIVALQDLIQYFYSYQSECQSMGVCFAKYFDNMWVENFYIIPYEEELKELQK